MNVGTTDKEEKSVASEEVKISPAQNQNQSSSENPENSLSAPFDAVLKAKPREKIAQTARNKTSEGASEFAQNNEADDESNVDPYGEIMALIKSIRPTSSSSSPSAVLPMTTIPLTPQTTLTAATSSSTASIVDSVFPLQIPQQNQNPFLVYPPESSSQTVSISLKDETSLSNSFFKRPPVPSSPISKEIVEKKKRKNEDKSDNISLPETSHSTDFATQITNTSKSEEVNNNDGGTFFFFPSFPRQNNILLSPPKVVPRSLSLPRPVPPPSPPKPVPAPSMPLEDFLIPPTPPGTSFEVLVDNERKMADSPLPAPPQAPQMGENFPNEEETMDIEDQVCDNVEEDYLSSLMWTPETARGRSREQQKERTESEKDDSGLCMDNDIEEEKEGNNKMKADIVSCVAAEENKGKDDQASSLQPKNQMVTPKRAPLPRLIPLEQKWRPNFVPLVDPRRRKKQRATTTSFQDPRRRRGEAITEAENAPMSLRVPGWKWITLIPEVSAAAFSETESLPPSESENRVQNDNTASTKATIVPPTQIISPLEGGTSSTSHEPSLFTQSPASKSSPFSVNSSPMPQNHQLNKSAQRDAALDDLRSLLQDAREQHAHQNAEMSRLRREIREKNTAVETLKFEKKAASTKYESIIVELKKKNAELEKKADTAAQRATQEVAQKLLRLDDLENGEKKKDSEIAKLCSERSELLRSHKEQLQRVRNERDEFVRELKLVRQLKETSDRDLSSTGSEQRTLKAQNEKLLGEADDLRAKNAELSKENATLKSGQDQVEKLQSKLRRSKEVKISAENALAAERKLREDAEQREQTVSVQRDELKTQLETLQQLHKAEIAQSAQELASVQAQLALKEKDAKKCSDAQNAKLDRKRKRIEELKNRLETERSERQQLEKELRTAHTENQKLQDAAKTAEECHRMELRLGEKLALLKEAKERSFQLEQQKSRLRSSEEVECSSSTTRDFTSAGEINGEVINRIKENLSAALRDARHCRNCETLQRELEAALEGRNEAQAKIRELEGIIAQPKEAAATKSDCHSGNNNDEEVLSEERWLGNRQRRQEECVNPMSVPSSGGGGPWSLGAEGECDAGGGVLRSRIKLECCEGGDEKGEEPHSASSQIPDSKTKEEEELLSHRNTVSVTETGGVFLESAAFWQKTPKQPVSERNSLDGLFSNTRDVFPPKVPALEEEQSPPSVLEGVEQGDIKHKLTVDGRKERQDCDDRSNAASSIATKVYLNEPKQPILLELSAVSDHTFSTTPQNNHQSRPESATAYSDISTAQSIASISEQRITALQQRTFETVSASMNKGADVEEVAAAESGRTEGGIGQIVPGKRQRKRQPTMESSGVVIDREVSEEQPKKHCRGLTPPVNISAENNSLNNSNNSIQNWPKLSIESLARRRLQGLWTPDEQRYYDQLSPVDRKTFDSLCLKLSGSGSNEKEKQPEQQHLNQQHLQASSSSSASTMTSINQNLKQLSSSSNNAENVQRATVGVHQQSQNNIAPYVPIVVNGGGGLGVVNGGSSAGVGLAMGGSSSSISSYRSYWSQQQQNMMMPPIGGAVSNAQQQKQAAPMQLQNILQQPCLAAPTTMASSASTSNNFNIMNQFLVNNNNNNIYNYHNNNSYNNGAYSGSTVFPSQQQLSAEQLLQFQQQIQKQQLQLQQQWQWQQQFSTSSFFFSDSNGAGRQQQ